LAEDRQRIAQGLKVNIILQMDVVIRGKGRSQSWHEKPGGKAQHTNQSNGERVMR
jgi:hypothetical protein